MSDNLESWREMLDEERKVNNDTSPIVHVAPDESVLDIRFDAGYGGTDGPPVLVWSENWVYFPVCYDGAEWLESVPRNPTNEGQSHVGGG